jgi:hypothetical protein
VTTAGKRRRSHHAAHEVRLGEARRQEVLARGLVTQGAIAIRSVESIRGVRQQCAHLGIAGDRSLRRSSHVRRGTRCTKEQKRTKQCS